MELAQRTAKWLNMPRQATVTERKVVIYTEPNTDFWQGTYYGFDRSNGHALLVDSDEETTFFVKATRTGKCLDDHCGILVYVDNKNWANLLLEYKDDKKQMLGSVMTTDGYSDWATRTVSAQIETMYFKVSRRGCDFLFEYSEDGKEYEVIRMFHIKCKSINPQIGVFSCCPQGEGYKAVFEDAQFTDCQWQRYVLE